MRVIGNWPDSNRQQTHTFVDLRFAIKSSRLTTDCGRALASQLMLYCIQKAGVRVFGGGSQQQGGHAQRTAAFADPKHFFSI